MNMLDLDGVPSLPGVLYYQPPCTFDLPFNVEVSDRWSVVGSGAGTGSTSIQTALGEYFERRHFYMEIFPEMKSTLEKTLSATETLAFIKCFKQTSDVQISTKALKSHNFSMSEVFRISDFSKCSIPTACVSLSHHGTEEDNFIYPARDTCGCSFHWSWEKALLGSIKESLERQFLSKFWLTKVCKRILGKQLVRAALTDKAQRLYGLLSLSGELKIIDISDDRYPGICTLAIYGSNNPQSNVRYCAGMSYAETASNAIEKSILELWQTYRFMNLFASLSGVPDKISDSYLRHFISCNSYNTFEEMSDIITDASITKTRKSPTQFKVHDLIKILRDNQAESYFYMNHSKINGIKYTFSKFISPAFFMHMDNSKNINTSNDYSSSFIKSIQTNRLNRMVPFP